jgi:endo-beta-N-acetylglucosaminidase D
MMATTKKTVAKKVVAKKTVEKKATVKPSPQYSMPVEVKDWIDQASSRLAYMTSEILRLKEENQKLKRANKVMETRVMGMSLE